jgi:hypothetical protein
MFMNFLENFIKKLSDDEMVTKWGRTKPSGY